MSPANQRRPSIGQRARPSHQVHQLVAHSDQPSMKVFQGVVRNSVPVELYTIIVLSISRVAPTQAATAKRLPGAAASTGSSVAQSTSST